MLNTFFLVAAVIGGTAMVCQFAMALLGLGDHALGGDGADLFDGDGSDFSGGHDGGDSFHDGDHAGHADGDAHAGWLFQALSLRTLTAAAAFFGVAGATATSAGAPPTAAVVVALAAGVAALYGVYWLLRGLGQLTSSGNEQIDQALGQYATVYVPIPAARHGAGKVQMSVQNRIVEYQAVTDEAEPLRTGEPVEVVAVSGDDLVCVRRLAAAV